MGQDCRGLSQWGGGVRRDELRSCEEGYVLDMGCIWDREQGG